MASQWLQVLQVISIVLSVAVTLFVLLQTRSAGLGSAFGGASAGSVFKTRRGIERLVFSLTIVFIILWAIVAVVSATLVRFV